MKLVHVRLGKISKYATITTAIRVCATGRDGGASVKVDSPIVFVKNGENISCVYHTTTNSLLLYVSLIGNLCCVKY